MSMFQKLFGAAKPTPPTAKAEETAAVIQKIQGVVELLEKKSLHLQKKIVGELVEAKVRGGGSRPFLRGRDVGCVSRSKRKLLSFPPNISLSLRVLHSFP